MGDPKQIELIDRFNAPAWVPTGQTDASLDAAAKVSRRGRADAVRRAVLLHLCKTPSTDHELFEAIAAGENTVRPRRRGLVLSELVEDSGERRKTPSGCSATVWRPTERGRAVARGELAMPSEGRRARGG